MKKVLKGHVTLIVDSTSEEPVGFFFFSQARDRVIYKCEKATEEEIISLLSEGLTQTVAPEK